MAEGVVEVLWTDRAKLTFNSIVDYLHDKWTHKEVENFIGRTSHFISTIMKYPEMCRASRKRPNIRIGIITRHTQIVYHFKPRKKQIVILYFWGTQQDPSRFKY